jgi:GNAT superfamily N-acetyltransferase
MMVVEYWKGGYKYFSIDLGDGEARMCLSPARASRINLESYSVDLFPVRKVFYVDFIKVSTKYRNSGHGERLLKAAIRWAKISNNIIILDAIPLDTCIDQHRLIRFYLRNGFKLSNPSVSKTAMYFHMRDKRVDENKLKKMVKEKCELYGVQFKLGRGKNVAYGGIQCSGFFDETVPMLAVATGKPSKEYIPVLIHEYNHMEQWRENCPVWSNLGNACGILDAWLEGKDYPMVVINDTIDRIIDVELDCERRTVDFMIRYDLPFDVIEYTKKSNAYVLFYNTIRETRKWYNPDRKPYNVPEVWSFMPETFTDHSYKLTAEQQELFAKL